MFFPPFALEGQPACCCREHAEPAHRGDQCECHRAAPVNGGVCALGFEKLGVCRSFPPPPVGGEVRFWGGRTADPAAGSVIGHLGQTGLLGHAANRSAGGERAGRAERPGGVLPAIEANPRSGGTVRPNTGAGPAGGGPPMAGHECQSVRVRWVRVCFCAWGWRGC